MEILIPPWEEIVLLEVAKKRNNPKEERGIHSTPWKYSDPLQSHILGIRGEYAVAKLLNLPLDLHFSLHGDNHEGDLIFPNGERISVKYRNKRGWDFALDNDNIGACLKAWYCILCYPGSKKDRIEVFGWSTKDEFIKNHTITDYGYGKRAVLHPRFFNRDFSCLMELTSDVILDTTIESLKAFSKKIII